MLADRRALSSATTGTTGRVESGASGSSEGGRSANTGSETVSTACAGVATAAASGGLATGVSASGEGDDTGIEIPGSAWLCEVALRDAGSRNENGLRHDRRGRDDRRFLGCRYPRRGQWSAMHRFRDGLCL